LPGGSVLLRSSHTVRTAADRFDLDGWDTGEGQGVGYGERVGGMQFMSPGRHIELDAAEGLVGQLCADLGAPGWESAACCSSPTTSGGRLSRIE
jgi:hypothetical protein